MMNTGVLFIIAAPSGAGKTSLVRALLERMPQLAVSVSHTTRKQRPGELEGENYFFVQPQQFADMAEQGCFLEHATVFDRSYGTANAQVEKQLVAGKDVVLEIDWQGAQQVRATGMPNISIFILPPSLATLERRLQSRAADDKLTIARRMRAAKSEISHYPEFDYVVINDDFNTALTDLQTIIHSQHLTRQCQQKKQQHLIAALL